jgi:hypothetical protein
VMRLCGALSTEPRLLAETLDRIRRTIFGSGLPLAVLGRGDARKCNIFRETSIYRVKIFRRSVDPTRPPTFNGEYWSIVGPKSFIQCFMQGTAEIRSPGYPADGNRRTTWTWRGIDRFR